MKPPKRVAWGWAFKRYHFNNWTKYKFTMEEFEEMWAAQNGCCAMCDLAFAHPERKDISKEGVKCYIDHRHTLGEMIDSKKKDVRGLLCFNCNTFLGVVKEDVNTLKRAYEYLMLRGVSEFEPEPDVPAKTLKRFNEIEVIEADGTKCIYKQEY